MNADESRRDLLRDAWLLTVSVIVIASSMFGYTANRNRIRDTNTVVHQINDRADLALFRANLVREKVCSQSNQGEACRALFQRLAENLSRAQRLRLACDTLAVLHGPGLREIRKASQCPKPIRIP